MSPFRNRHEAGRLLGERLRQYAGQPDVVVLGLPRGGVPVAFEVARFLGAPLDVCVVRKLGVPGHEELAMGAVAQGGLAIVNREIVEPLRIPQSVISTVADREAEEVVRREKLYRGDRPPLDVEGRTVILVDDGLATGATMAVAAMALRYHDPKKIVVAAPVGAPSTLEDLRDTADETVCVYTPESFRAVGEWYVDFSPTRDEEVQQLLSAEAQGDVAEYGERAVSIPVDDMTLEGDLWVPTGAEGIVVFAHGSGSSRHSPRNQYVARALEEAGLATLLLDLLTEDEERTESSKGFLRFDIELLAARLMSTTDWLRQDARTRGLGIGYFGASTGAAAALVAAVARGTDIQAVVSRGGRPDLATSALSRVQAPVLLIVGGDDTVTLDLNRKALQELAVEKRLEIVPGASHLFEEPGTLERVADLARDWFVDHLSKIEALAHRTAPAEHQFGH